MSKPDMICGLYSKLVVSNKPWSWWMTEHLFNESQDKTDPSYKIPKWSYNLEKGKRSTHVWKGIAALIYIGI